MQPEVQPPQQSANWQYIPQQNAVSGATNQVPSENLSISWTASEFVSYEKGFGWYLSVTFALLVIGLITFIITSKDIVSTASIIIIGIIFVIFARRKPRVLTYQIDNSGIRIGEKLYQFNSVRSFAVVDEGSIRSVYLMPIQRFMPAISMYFEPKGEQQIINVLGSFLPQEQRQQELIDRIMHKIRF
jgi:hypothetical protein